MTRPTCLSAFSFVSLIVAAAQSRGDDPTATVPTPWVENQTSVSAAPESEVMAELRALRAEIEALKGAANESDWTELAPIPGPCEPRLCSSSASEKAPAYPTARLTGFFHADALWISQETANRIAVGNGNPADGDAQDGADFRRARLAATGKAWDNIAYMLEMDFAFPGRPSFMDVWLEGENIVGDASVRVGQFRSPFGMDALTGVKELTFLERALPTALVPFRQIGIMIHGNAADDLMTWAVSGFRFPTDPFGGNVGDNGGFGLATRMTGLLARSADDKLLHVGGGYSFIDPANDLVQYRNQPEVFVGETGGAALVPSGVPSNLPFFIDTGALSTTHTQLFNAELAGVLGRAHFQSEAIYAVVTEPNGDNLVFPGAYAQAGYFLTGESRSYNTGNGVLSGVRPNRCVGKECGLGAWEIAGRWSSLDLNDGTIQGGRLNNLTAGLNWYWNPNTKFQFNYIHSILDKSGFGESSADLFAMRAQLTF